MKLFPAIVLAGLMGCQWIPQENCYILTEYNGSAKTFVFKHQGDYRITKTIRAEAYSVAFGDEKPILASFNPVSTGCVPGMRWRTETVKWDSENFFTVKVLDKDGSTRTIVFHVTSMEYIIPT